MPKVKVLLKRAFTPITIMFIPHSDAKPRSLKIPSVGILISAVLCITSFIYIYTVSVNAVEYRKMEERLNYYSGHFVEMSQTMSALKNAEMELRKLFSFKTKEAILENMDSSDNGSIDMEALQEQIKRTMEDVGEIREYLSQERDVYLATPMGWPVEGRISSSYGYREHPKTKKRDFHSGMDIAADAGLPVKATADGVVSFAGWSGGNGNLIALEHGLGYSTYYAHNRSVLVKVGQKVKRGDVIGHVGSTGNSTGPHLHYEVWKKGKAVNPYTFVKGGS
jgi:murein DD-endopeptidase MepM/ murein hydrolase activator NlpD